MARDGKKSCEIREAPISHDQDQDQDTKEEAQRECLLSTQTFT